MPKTKVSELIWESKLSRSMSHGEKAESPSYKKLDRKIRKLQRKLARQPKDSKRRNRTRIQIAKLHNRIADARKDFLHKLSTKIVNENQVIVWEDLNVSGMVKNRFPCKGN
ncbi:MULTISPECIES: transposase [unclassified Microcoleus]|uniref:transposase n=1 Tax=unclassified Microcoleus TaxID=2642155 RepID=UPI002FD6C7EF